MKNRELFEQLRKSTIIQPGDSEVCFGEFEVVTAINFGQGNDEQRIEIELVIFDHDRRQVVLVQRP